MRIGPDDLPLTTRDELFNSEEGALKAEVVLLICVNVIISHPWFKTYSGVGADELNMNSVAHVIWSRIHVRQNCTEALQKWWSIEDDWGLGGGYP